jgi:hypothetical protein
MSLLGIIVFLIALGAAIVAGMVQKRWPTLQSIMQGLFVSYVTVLLMLVGAELYFRFVYADSGYWWTLARANWEDRYVEMNALGFRDREWHPEDTDGKQTVLVLGDSFTMGDGVENIEDRFGDVLGEHLGDDYAVINLGIADTSTRDQLDVLKDYPIQNPDVVVWQYFLNDINDAGASIGDQYWPNVPTDWPQFVDESYFANLVYWRLAPYFTAVDTADKDSFWGWAYYAYDNSAIWSIHAEEIHNLVAYVDSIDARLIVVIFPNLRDPVSSIPYVDRVAQALEAEGVTDVLRLYDAAADFIENREESIIVSARDDHPSAAFHRLVGDMLYERYFSE